MYTFRRLILSMMFTLSFAIADVGLALYDGNDTRLNESITLKKGLNLMALPLVPSGSIKASDICFGQSSIDYIDNPKDDAIRYVYRYDQQKGSKIFHCDYPGIPAWFKQWIQMKTDFELQTGYGYSVYANEDITLTFLGDKPNVSAISYQEATNPITLRRSEWSDHNPMKGYYLLGVMHPTSAKQLCANAKMQGSNLKRVFAYSNGRYISHTCGADNFTNVDIVSGQGFYAYFDGKYAYGFRRQDMIDYVVSTDETVDLYTNTEETWYKKEYSDIIPGMPGKDSIKFSLHAFSNDSSFMQIDKFNFINDVNKDGQADPFDYEEDVEFRLICGMALFHQDEVYIRPQTLTSKMSNGKLSFTTKPFSILYKLRNWSAQKEITEYPSIYSCKIHSILDDDVTPLLTNYKLNLVWDPQQAIEGEKEESQMALEKIGHSNYLREEVQQVTAGIALPNFNIRSGKSDTIGNNGPMRFYIYNEQGEEIEVGSPLPSDGNYRMSLDLGNVGGMENQELINVSFKVDDTKCGNLHYNNLKSVSVLEAMQWVKIFDRDYDFPPTCHGKWRTYSMKLFTQDKQSVTWDDQYWISRMSFSVGR